MDEHLQQKIRDFLEWGRQKVAMQDRGALSNLKRGFNKGTEQRCWPYIARYCDLTRDRERIIWQTIAAGFAFHEKSVAAGSLGVTLRKLALEGATGKAEDALHSFDARFRRLLSCTKAQEVCLRLPGILKAAGSKNDIPVDYARLFEDLWFWSEPVKLRWAADYWNPEKTAATVEDGA